MIHSVQFETVECQSQVLVVGYFTYETCYCQLYFVHHYVLPKKLGNHILALANGFSQQSSKAYIGFAGVVFRHGFQYIEEIV